MYYDLVFPYFPGLRTEQIEQFKDLGLLYRKWNEQINVISRKDIEHIYERHVLHSLAIAKFISFADHSEILDLGTGGGFPGIPLAILFPDCKFHLVDSRGKKIKVVEEISRALKLTNVSVEHTRAEKVEGKYDFIISRAVAAARQLYLWGHQKISSEQRNEQENGFILLKGGDLTDEMKELNRPYQKLPISSFFNQDFFETKHIIYIRS